MPPIETAVSADSIVGQIIAQMPEPSHSETAGLSNEPPAHNHLSPAEEEAGQLSPSAEAKRAEMRASVPRDSLGRLFDPAKFAANPDGSPRVDTKGRFFSANLGRKPASAKAAAQAPAQSFIPEDAGRPAAQAAPAPAASTSPSPTPSAPDEFALLADVYCRAGIAGAMAAFGPEWEPDDKGEYAALRDSVATYMRATGRKDLSPGWALCFAVGTYAAKRVPRPKTQTRLAGFFGALRAWWQGRRVSRAVAAMPQPTA